MEARDFCYWLQGGFELNPDLTLDQKTVVMIRKHLDMTLKHIEPEAEAPKPPFQGNVRC